MCVFVPQFLSQFGHPPTSQLSPIIEQLLARRVKVDKIAKCILSNCCISGIITHSEESTICPLLHMRAYRWPQLASATVINRRERVCHLSHPERTASLAPLAPGYGELGHCWDLNLQPPNHRMNTFFGPLGSRFFFGSWKNPELFLLSYKVK